MRIVTVTVLGLCIGSAIGLYLDSNPGHPVPLPQPRPHIETPEQYEARLAALAENVQCLRDLVFTEARGESLEGQHLVAWVAWQRHLDNRADFGQGSLCDVVYKQTQTPDGFKSQFAGPVHHPVPPNLQSPSLRRAFYVAWRVVAGRYVAPDRYKSARYYYNRKDSDNDGRSWHRSLIPVGVEGRHIFSQDSVPLPRPRPKTILAAQ